MLRAPCASWLFQLGFAGSNDVQTYAANRSPVSDLQSCPKIYSPAYNGLDPEFVTSEQIFLC